ncbi:MAG TPA: MFS transporter, partial [Thermoplasmata archaeon]
TGYGFGAVVALFASGWIRDFFGSYTPAFYIGIALSAMGLVLSLGVRPPKPVIVGAEIERVPA